MVKMKMTTRRLRSRRFCPECRREGRTKCYQVPVGDPTDGPAPGEVLQPLSCGHCARERAFARPEEVL